MTHNGKSLISLFQEFSTSINKTFFLAGRLGLAAREATRTYYVYK